MMCKKKKKITKKGGKTHYEVLKSGYFCTLGLGLEKWSEIWGEEGERKGKLGWKKENGDGRGWKRCLVLVQWLHA